MNDMTVPARNSLAIAAQQVLLSTRPPVFAIMLGAFEVSPHLFERVPAGATFDSLCPADGGAWICRVNDEWISRADWWQEPRGGDVIVFCRAPQGRDATRIIATIVVLVASYYTGGALSAAGYSAGASAAGAAAVGIAGNLLISALIPLASQNFENSSDNSPTYSVSLQGNQARLDQVQPVLYGHNKTFPDYACQPYYRYEQGNQILYVCLQVGLGQYSIPRVAIDDTPLDDFIDVSYLVVGPGQTLTTLAEQHLVETNVITATEVSGQTMVYQQWVGPFVATGPGQLCTKISIDIVFPYGLMGPTPNYGVGWTFVARRVDDFEQPAGPWFNLKPGPAGSHETYVTASATPIRLTFDYPVPAGRYQVRGQRISQRTTNPNEPHDITWAGMRATLAEAGVINEHATFIVARIRASEQLNSISSRRISVISDRMLPIWNGLAWSAPQVTRSIAWAATDVLRNSIYGRSLDDPQIDLPTYLALDAEWEERRDHFDHVFDVDGDTWSALATILLVGRAVPLIRGSRYTAVRDSLQTLPVAGYTMRNIKQGSFQLSYTLAEPDEIDCVQLEYTDLRTWDTAQACAQVVNGEIVGYLVNRDADVPAEVPDPENPITIQVAGIIDQFHALREAAYRMADMRYRRRMATWVSELDGLLPSYGSLVSVAHDVPAWGQSGDVWQWDAGQLIVSTTEPLDWSGIGPFFIRLQTRIGGLTTPIPVTRLSSTDNGCKLSASPGIDLITDDPARERTRYIFGPSSAYGADCRVKAIKPNSSSEIQLSVVLEDNRVHAADGPWLGKETSILIAGQTTDTGGSAPTGSIVKVITGGDIEYSGPVGSVMFFSLVNDGTIHARYGPSADESTQQPFDGTTGWLYPQPVSPAVAGHYQVVASYVNIGASSNNLQGTFDTILPLSETRTWAAPPIARDTDGNVTGGTLCKVHFQITDRDGVFQGEFAIYFVLNLESPTEGGGGE